MNHSEYHARQESALAAVKAIADRVDRGEINMSQGETEILEVMSALERDVSGYREAFKNKMAIQGILIKATPYIMLVAVIAIVGALLYARGPN